MAYIRKGTKDHGISSLIEGAIPPVAKILLIEDLITDGKSKLDFIKTLRDTDCQINHCLVLLDRGQGGAEHQAFPCRRE